MMELMGLMNLLSGGQQTWVEATLLACFFWVAVAKPDRIYSLARFRAACILFALAMLAPAFINLSLLGSSTNPFGGGMGGRQDPGIAIYLQAVSPTLLVFSFLLGIDSVMPRPTPSGPRLIPPMPS